MKIASSRILAGAAALVVAACAESSSPGQPSGGPLGVTVAPSTLSCHPHPNAPCSVSVEAVVTNASGPVSYVWSGCGSGTARNTTCTVERPDQQLSVAVEVTDGRGQTARATGTPTGTNLPPTVTITDFVLWESWNAAAGGGSFEVAAGVGDPEHPSNSGCGGVPSTRTVVATGICDKGYVRCFGDLEVGALKTAAAGMCVLTFSGADEWGLTGTTTKTFTLPHK